MRWVDESAQSQSSIAPLGCATREVALSIRSTALQERM